MRVNEIVEIANGNLINQPQISYFENITTKLDQVVRGSLFITTQEADVKRAIELGAYGILFEDGDLNLIDEECAWIRVDSLQDAIMRLIRYHLLSRNISVFYLQKIEFEIAQEIVHDCEVYFLQGGCDEFLEAVQRQSMRKIIINNQNLLDIPLDYTRAISPENEVFKIISCTLFDSKIYFDSKRYTLSLPSIFLGRLSAVMALCLNEEIAFSLDTFESISHLRPIFITPKNIICPYGQSRRVLLAEKETEHFKYYSSYIMDNAKWARICSFVPREKQKDFSQAIPYDDLDSLLESIKRENFNFALILGVSSDFLLENLPHSIEEMSLFDE